MFWTGVAGRSKNRYRFQHLVESPEELVRVCEPALTVSVSVPHSESLCGLRGAAVVVKPVALAAVMEIV